MVDGRTDGAEEPHPPFPFVVALRSHALLQTYSLQFLLTSKNTNFIFFDTQVLKKYSV